MVIDREVQGMNATVQAVAETLHSARVADIGANNGATARQMLGWLPDLPRLFWCIEPDPRNLKMLADEALPSPCEIMPFAIGAADGDAWLRMSDSATAKGPGGIWAVSSTLREPTGHYKAFPEITFERRCQVKVRSFDSLCAERGVAGFDMLWVDIEGSERDFIAGGRATLALSRYLFIEAWGDELYKGMATRDELIAMLPDWEVIGAWSADIFLRNKQA